jgi:hypothetical protein
MRKKIGSPNKSSDGFDSDVRQAFLESFDRLEKRGLLPKIDRELVNRSEPISKEDFERFLEKLDPKFAKHFLTKL